VLAAGTRLIQGGAEPQPPLLLFTGEAFDDCAALFEAVCERELEGVVAKRRSGRYRRGAPRNRTRSPQSRFQIVQRRHLEDERAAQLAAAIGTTLYDLRAMRL
jgi:hypothetical protein